MARKFYGSANNAATLATDLYGGSSNGAQKIAKLYGPAGSVTVGVTGTIRAGGSGNVTAFDGETFWGAAKSLLDSSKTVEYLEVICLVPGVYSLMIYYTDNTHAYLVQQTLSAAQLLAYGITAVANPTSGTADSIDLTPITSTATMLIHQGFGHLDYYGTVAYYTDSNHTDIAIQTLHSAQNIRGLSGYSHQTRLTWSVTINGVSISNKDIYGVTLTEKLKALPSYFLSGCSALNSDLILPSSLIAINDSGEQNGSAFLYRCDGMTATVNVGNLPTSIVKSITNASFSTGNDSSAAAFTQGIKIAGANRAAWLAAFPNRSSYTPYRKLVDAGY